MRGKNRGVAAPSLHLHDCPPGILLSHAEVPGLISDDDLAQLAATDAEAGAPAAAPAFAEPAATPAAAPAAAAPAATDAEAAAADAPSSARADSAALAAEVAIGVRSRLHCLLCVVPASATARAPAVRRTCTALYFDEPDESDLEVRPSPPACPCRYLSRRLPCPRRLPSWMPWRLVAGLSALPFSSSPASTVPTASA